MNKNKMKTILSIWHTADKGKTETLREFANLLLVNYPTYSPIFPTPANVPLTGDFRLVININGKIVGIESQGDPNTDLEDRLIDLADNFNCEIIVCSSRTRGETVWAIDNVASAKGFQTIWTSTYQITNSAQHTLVNQLKAQHILSLFQSLRLL